MKSQIKQFAIIEFIYSNKKRSWIGAFSIIFIIGSIIGVSVLTSPLFLSEDFEITMFNLLIFLGLPLILALAIMYKILDWANRYIIKDNMTIHDKYFEFNTLNNTIYFNEILYIDIYQLEIKKQSYIPHPVVLKLIFRLKNGTILEFAVKTQPYDGYRFIKTKAKHELYEVLKKLNIRLNYHFGKRIIYKHKPN